MKKVVCFGLCFLIVLSSFVLTFASGSSPVILPIGSSSDVGTGLKISYGSSDRYFRSNVSPVYLVFARIGGSVQKILFSDIYNAAVYYGDQNSNYTTYYLTTSYGGFYLSSSGQGVEDSYIYGDFDSVESLIDDINSSVFSTTFDLTYLINGSVSWLSSMAQAVKNNGLLLFFVAVVFVGVGIGLFNRFRR